MFVSGRAMTIEHAIVAQGHASHADLATEGVEACQQFDFLREIDCCYAYGRLISKPELLETVIAAR
ncbi:MAG: hypothetical protein ABI365_10160 [Lysobacteraceae bacterium]